MENMLIRFRRVKLGGCYKEIAETTKIGLRIVIFKEEIWS